MGGPPKIDWNHSKSPILALEGWISMHRQWPKRAGFDDDHHH